MPDLKLTIYSDRSIYSDSDGHLHEFPEGAINATARERMRKVRSELERGFLRDLILSEKERPQEVREISVASTEKIVGLVDAVTSEVGRALIGISIMQLTIKSICPEQSIRLHKGGAAGGENFSWVDGISMRTLDKGYITPVLREFDLLKLNADGFMMTRSLAENYPYTALYKAAIRGGKKEWLHIVEELESGRLSAIEGLRYLISLLLNRSSQFQGLSSACILLAAKFVKQEADPWKLFNFIEGYVKSCDYSARVFEIALHAAYQALDELHLIEGYLKPISQMRSANKKHGNVGDIEIMETRSGMLIKEAWDAKYGKSQLREELEELSEKLSDHPECRVAGFISNIDPVITPEIDRRLLEVSALHDCEIRILSFRNWFASLHERLGPDAGRFAHKWLLAMTESLCQKRREMAPIDEPCEHWIKTLTIKFREAVG